MHGALWENRTSNTLSGVIVFDPRGLGQHFSVSYYLRQYLVFNASMRGVSLVVKKREIIETSNIQGSLLPKA